MYISRLFLWYGLDSRTVNRGWHAILHMMLSISLHHAWWLASLTKILQAKNHASLAKASCIHTGSCTWPLFWRHVFSRPNRPNRNVMVWDLPHRLLTSLGSWLGCRSRFIASCSHRSFLISDRSRRCRRSRGSRHRLNRPHSRPRQSRCFSLCFFVARASLTFSSCSCPSNSFSNNLWRSWIHRAIIKLRTLTSVLSGAYPGSPVASSQLAGALHASGLAFLVWHLFGLETLWSEISSRRAWFSPSNSRDTSSPPPGTGERSAGVLSDQKGLLVSKDGGNKETTSKVGSAWAHNLSEALQLHTCDTQRSNMRQRNAAPGAQQCRKKI